jgi:hypothetical protein
MSSRESWREDGAEDGSSGSRLKTAVIYGGGGLLVLAGLGAMSEGGLGVVGGLLWVLAGLVTIPQTRQVVIGAVDGAGGPDLSSVGRVGVAGFVVIALVIGVGIIPTDDTENTSQPEGASPTDSPEPTEASDQSGSSSSDGGAADTETPTSEPTPTQEPTPTPTQEPTPTPTATPTPEPTPAPDGESYDYSGSGQTATDRFTAEGGLLTLDLSHQGQQNFIVYLVDAETGEEQLLVNTIGDFDGTVATNVGSGEYLLDIQADGSWEAGIEQPRYSVAEVSSLPADASEEDYAVLGPFQFEGVTRFTIDAETDGNVIAYLMDHRGNEVQLLVNEIGPHEGSTTIRQEGIGLIYVETKESWTVTLEQA